MATTSCHELNCGLYLSTTQLCYKYQVTYPTSPRTHSHYWLPQYLSALLCCKYRVLTPLLLVEVMATTGCNELDYVLYLSALLNSVVNIRVLTPLLLEVMATTGCLELDCGLYLSALLNFVVNIVLTPLLQAEVMATTSCHELDCVLYLSTLLNSVVNIESLPHFS